MRFLADMGVAIRMVEWLREEGHDARHLREEALQRVPDDQIFAKAIAENRIVLTFDLDFGEIVALSKRQTVSVVIFRLVPCIATESVVVPPRQGLGCAFAGL